VAVAGGVAGAGVAGGSSGAGGVAGGSASAGGAAAGMLAARVALVFSNAAIWAFYMARVGRGASKELHVSAVFSPTHTLPGLGLLVAERLDEYFLIMSNNTR
jgi:hypothetical protein